MSSPSPSELVIESVSKATGTGATDLPSLYDAIDPDALDALVRTMATGKIEFRYASCLVTVESSGSIQIDSAVPTG